MIIVAFFVLAGVLLLIAIMAGIYTGIRQGMQQISSQKRREQNAKTDDTVYVYPSGKVYHKSMFCSDSKSVPTPMSEKIAQIQGLHRCTKCWK